jgi:hypothetical protein
MKFGNFYTEFIRYRLIRLELVKTRFLYVVLHSNCDKSLDRVYCQPEVRFIGRTKHFEMRG